MTPDHDAWQTICAQIVETKILAGLCKRGLASNWYSLSQHHKQVMFDVIVGARERLESAPRKRLIELLHRTIRHAQFRQVYGFLAPYTNTERHEILNVIWKLNRRWADMVLDCPHEYWNVEFCPVLNMRKKFPSSGYTIMSKLRGLDHDKLRLMKVLQWMSKPTIFALLERTVP